MLKPNYQNKSVSPKQEYKALETIYVCGKWINRGEVFTMPNCGNCIQKLIKEGKAEKV